MPPPSFDEFSQQRRGMKRAAYKRHAKINIPVDFIISIHHDARHTLHFRCLFDACISTNCACLIWPNKLRSFHWTTVCATNVYPIRCIMTSIDILFISINLKSGSVSIFRTNLLQTTLDSKRNFRFFKLCSRNSNVTAFWIFLSDSIETIFLYPSLLHKK